MNYNPGRAETYTSPALPEFIEPNSFEQMLKYTPDVVNHGLNPAHKQILFAGKIHDDLTVMSDIDLVARANDKDHTCALRAWQRGYDYVKPGGVGTYTGSIETQVLYAERKGHALSRQTVIQTVEELVEPVVQAAIRDKLFSRIKQVASRDVDGRSVDELAELVARYNPQDVTAVSELAKLTFDFHRSLLGKNGASPKRGVAPIETQRLQYFFNDVIGANNPHVQRDKQRILHNTFTADIDSPRSLRDRVLRRTAGRLTTTTQSRLNEFYAEYDKELDVAHFVPTPGAGQRLVDQTVEKVGDVDLATATKAAALSGLSLSLLLGTQQGAAASPEKTSFSISQLSEAADLHTEPVAAFSAVPAMAEKTLSKEQAADRAFKAEIDRRVAHSKTLTGMWAQWETVDADVLYRAILKYEKQHNHPVINRYVILEQLTQESQLKINAVSRAGAKGLTQFMPGTWKSHGHGKSPFDPDAAVRAQYELDIQNYNHLRKQFPHKSQDEILRLTLAAYNAGLDEHVQRGEIPPYKETRDYVRIIMGKLHDLKKRMPEMPRAAAPARPRVNDNNNGATKRTAPEVDQGGKTFSLSDILASQAPDATIDAKPVSLETVLQNSDVQPNTPSIDMAAVRRSLEKALGLSAAHDGVAEAPASGNALASKDDTASTARMSHLALQNALNTPHEAAPVLPSAPLKLDAVTPEVVTVPTSPDSPTPPQVTPPAHEIGATPVVPDSVSTPQVTVPTPDVTVPAASSDPTPEAAPVAPSTSDSNGSVGALGVFDGTQQASAAPAVFMSPDVAPTQPATLSDITAAATPDSTTLNDTNNNPSPVVPSAPEVVASAPQPAVAPVVPPVIAPAPAPKKAEASPKPTVKPSVDALRAAEIARLKQSGDFKQSQALDNAPRTPLEDKLAASGEKNGRLHDVEKLGDRWGDASLYAPAAEQFRKMDAAFYAHFGRHIKINDSYRSYSRQVATKADAEAKGRSAFAATPGHSKHGWGLALDLGGGMQSFNSAEYKWMKANALKFGFNHPDFADDSATPEPWHWEYVLSE